MLSVLLQTEQEQWNAERDSEKKNQSALIRKMWLMRDRVGLGWGLVGCDLDTDMPQDFSVIEIQKTILDF